MARKPTIKSLKKNLWTVFSKYIRLKFADKNGNVKCVTCGIIKHWKEMQAGHAVSGRTNSILFVEEIVHPQCVSCNIYKNGNYERFIPYMIHIYGLEGYEHFANLKHSPTKFTIQELEDMIDEYSEKVKEFEKAL